MTGSVNIGGTWKDLSLIDANINGVWKPIDQGFLKEGGVWHQFFSGSKPNWILRFQSGSLEQGAATSRAFHDLDSQGNIYIAFRTFAPTSKIVIFKISPNGEILWGFEKDQDSSSVPIGISVSSNDYLALGLLWNTTGPIYMEFHTFDLSGNLIQARAGNYLNATGTSISSVLTPSGKGIIALDNDTIWVSLNYALSTVAFRSDIFCVDMTNGQILHRYSTGGYQYSVVSGFKKINATEIIWNHSFRPSSNNFNFYATKRIFNAYSPFGWKQSYPIATTGRYGFTAAIEVEPGKHAIASRSTNTTANQLEFALFGFNGSTFSNIWTSEFEFPYAIGPALVDLKADASNNIYLFVATNPVAATTSGVQVIQIIKMDSNGNIIWSNQIDGARFIESATSVRFVDDSIVFNAEVYTGTTDYTLTDQVLFKLPQDGSGHGTYAVGETSFVYSLATYLRNTISVTPSQPTTFSSTLEQTVFFSPASITYSAASMSSDIVQI